MDKKQQLIIVRYGGKRFVGKFRTQESISLF